MSKTTECIMFSVCMVIIFGVFAFFDYRYLDIEFLGLTNGDELPQFQQLQQMYESLLEHNVPKFFSFGFYNYGFIYYVLNLIVVLPFHITSNYEMAIYAPRILNAVFSIATLCILYVIFRYFLDVKRSFLLIVACICMAGFWKVGFIFKPDVFQSCFVMLSAYFLLRDNFTFSKNYTLGVMTLALGIGMAKFQAILFIPMLYAYICMPFCFERNRASLYLALKRIGICSLWIIGIYFLSNPYLFHPKGIKAWYSMFYFNMQSNATNHGSYTQVSLSEKIYDVIDFYYFEICVFVVLLALCVWSICAFLKDCKHYKDSIFIPIIIGFLISLGYLLFFVNKTWETYYYSTIMLGFIPLVLLVRLRYGIIVCGVIIALFIGGGIFHKSYTKVFTKYYINLDSAYILSNEILALLSQSAPKDRIYNILTDTPHFAYLKLGLQPKNILQTFGMLDEESFVYSRWSEKPHLNPFVPKDFILLNKNGSFFDQNVHGLKETKQKAQETLKRLQDGKLPYKKIGESEHFILFKNIDSSHSLIPDTIGEYLDSSLESR